MSRDVFASLSEALTSGVVLAWKCRPGDHVKAGEVLAEIETDKATFELEAPEDGVVTAIIVPAGEPFDRGSALLRLEPRSLEGRPSDLERNPVPPPVPAARRVITPSEERCKFCHTLRVAGRHDCVRCGAPL